MPRKVTLENTRNIGIMAHIDAGNNDNRAYFVLHRREL